MSAVPSTPGQGGSDAGPRRPKTPDSGTQALRLARYQFRDYLRSRRFVLMLTIVGVIGGILTALLAHYRPPDVLSSGNAFYSALWSGFAGVVIVFAGIIFGGDAIAGEFQNKTGYFLMGLPVRRSSVYVGKYLAAFAAALVSLLFFLVILIANAALYLGPAALSVALGESLGLAVLYLLALLGTTFLFSSLFKTSVYAVLVVAVMFLFGFTLIDTIIEAVASYEPWFSIVYGGLIIGYPLGGIPEHMSRGLVGGVTFFPAYTEGLAIILGYFAVTSVLGLVQFEREQFT